MLISTKGRYALRVMIDLAEHRSGEFISLKEIAQRQEISEKYLESIIRMLVKAKAVESLRGKGGGYRLTKNRAVHGGQHSAADGGIPRPGILSGGERRNLLPIGAMPHAGAVAGTG